MPPQRTRACEDFHRTARRHAPRSASRRQLARLGAGAGLSLYTAQALPLGRMLEAAAQARRGARRAVLVSVFLPGGLDLLDSLVPLDQYGAYRDTRGALIAQPDELARARQHRPRGRTRR